jgi:putative hemolysin
VFLVEEVSLSVLRLRGSQLHAHRLFGNREELRAVMAEAAQALTSDEHTMVNRVLDLQHYTVSQLTIPLAKTISVANTSSLAETLQLARDKNLSRFPVWEMRAGKNCVAGLLEVNGILFREALDLNRKAGEFMLPALFIDESVRLEVALRRMQRSGQRMAIVLDHEQNEVGIVALEDILKVMFGEVKL